MSKTDLDSDFDEIRDITVIGAGPVGLCTAFWAGMREASVRVIDSLPTIGGQVLTLYPEKWIYDIPGYPRLLGKDLIDQLRVQSLDQFDVPVHLETTAETIGWEPDPENPEKNLVVLNTTEGKQLRSRALIVAGGHGAFEPKKLPGIELDEWEDRGLHYFVKEKSEFAGKRVVIVGGGDSACDWTVNLLDVAEQVTLVHRREGFRAHEATVQQIQVAQDKGEIDVFVPHQIRTASGDGRLERIVLFHSENEDETVELECDALLLQLGFKTALGPLKEWEFEISRGALVVNHTMKTNLENVWACGDITTFEGKIKLIATGFGEAAIAVGQAVHAIRPETKLQPKYSTNTGVPVG